MVLRGRGPDHGVALIADGSQPAKVAAAVIDGDQVSRARRLRRAAVTDSTLAGVEDLVWQTMQHSRATRRQISLWLLSAWIAGSAWFPRRLSAREFEIRGLLGANRTTNANMLSLCCEFLKPAQARWFRKFG